MPTFCDRCGAPLVPGDQRCRTCGWPVPVPLTPAERGDLGSPAGAGSGVDPALGPDDDPTPMATRAVREDGSASGRGRSAGAGAGAGAVLPSVRDEAGAVGTDGSPYGERTQRMVLPGEVATDPLASVPARPAAGSPWERPRAAAEPPDAGWTPAPTESYAAPPPTQPPGVGGGLDDPSAYGRWRLEPEPELAQWREEPPKGEAPVRRAFGVVDDDRPSGSRIAVRVLAILAAAVVVVLVGLSVLVFGVLRGSGDRAPAGAATRSATPKVVAPPPKAGATSTQPAKATTTPTPTPTTTSYPPVALPGKACGGSGNGPWSRAAAGSSQTSCPFAIAVQQAYLASSPAPNQPRTVAATSPVTGKAYPMACTGDQPVTCAGGNGAVVYLYGGVATFH